MLFQKIGAALCLLFDLQCVRKTANGRWLCDVLVLDVLCVGCVVVVIVVVCGCGEKSTETRRVFRVCLCVRKFLRVMEGDAELWAASRREAVMRVWCRSTMALWQLRN